MRGSYRYSLVLPALALLVGAGRLSGQRQATARLTAVIPAIVKLETVSTGGTAVQMAGFTEVRSAVVLRVRANCQWRLVAVRQGEPVEMRVAASAGTAGVASEFVPLTSEPRQVALGGPSASVEVVVDYRIGPGMDPAPVAYELKPLE